MEKLLEDIREICAINMTMDWSDKDPAEEFEAILNLITSSKHHE
jgi:hypothetical protein